MIYHLPWVQLMIYLSIFTGIYGFDNKENPLEKQHDMNDTKPKKTASKQGPICGTFLTFNYFFSFFFSISHYWPNISNYVEHLFPFSWLFSLE